ncbi:MAG: hypothetical protein A2Z71_10145 [Chloroflexi bacterium RBG_13_50_21]|nr:MAG: hypothetical protein A2Z71_10145 [Chloroflexi bacterium RBG_13_50_21]
MKKELLHLFSIVTLCLIVASLTLPMPVRAAGTVGNGDPGSCTESALDAVLSGGGLVNFNCGPNQVTITITNQKTISANTTMDGGNLITLDGGNTTRLFTVNAGVTLDLKALGLTGGSASQGGAIYNDGTVIIKDVLLTNSFAPGGTAGGIYNNGTLTITHSTLSGTAASNGQAGTIYNLGALTVANSNLSYNLAGLVGGSLYNKGTATITSSTFEGNSGSTGGAIANSGTLTIRGSTFNANSTVSSVGGGIYNDANLTIYTSTFSENTTYFGERGGGLFNGASGSAVIHTSTFINNSAPGGYGGGIYNDGQLTVLADTFTGNSNNGGVGGGIYSSINTTTIITDSTFFNNFGGAFGGGVFTSGPTSIVNSTFYANNPSGVNNGSLDIVSIKNTILAGNTVNNCFGTITSLGNNLEDAADCSLSEQGDLSYTDPMLGPLANNGGPTLTHALLKGSPAINAGTNAGCPSADQRGLPRPMLGTCDIGAYEFGFAILLPVISK